MSWCVQSLYVFLFLLGWQESCLFLQSRVIHRAALVYPHLTYYTYIGYTYVSVCGILMCDAYIGLAKFRACFSLVVWLTITSVVHMRLQVPFHDCKACYGSACIRHMVCSMRLSVWYVDSYGRVRVQGRVRLRRKGDVLDVHSLSGVCRYCGLSYTVFVFYSVAIIYRYVVYSAYRARYDVGRVEDAHSVSVTGAVLLIKAFNFVIRVQRLLLATSLTYNIYYHADLCQNFDW